MRRLVLTATALLITFHAPCLAADDVPVSEVPFTFEKGYVVVALSSSTAKKLGFAVPAEKGQPRDDQIDSLRVGEHEVAGVPVLIAAKGTPLEKALGDHGAVAGTAFPQHFLVTFDFRGKSVTLANNM